MVLGMITRRATQRQQKIAARSALRATLNSASVSTSASPLATATVSRGASALAARRAIPEHRAGDVTGIVAGVAIVGAIVGVGKMWWDASSSPAGGKKYPVAFEEIPQHEVAKFFKELIANVQSLFVRRSSPTMLCASLSRRCRRSRQPHN